MKKIEIEETVTKFEAFDGKVFNTEAECQLYEGSNFGVLLEQIKDCIIKRENHSGMLSSDYYFEPYSAYYYLVPKTRHDINVLNKILEIAGNNKEVASGSDCNELLILCVNQGCNALSNAHIVHVDEWIKTMTRGQFTVVSTIKDTAKNA